MCPSPQVELLTGAGHDAMLKKVETKELIELEIGLSMEFLRELHTKSDFVDVRAYWDRVARFIIQQFFTFSSWPNQVYIDTNPDSDELRLRVAGPVVAAFDAAPDPTAFAILLHTVAQGKLDQGYYDATAFSVS